MVTISENFRMFYITQKFFESLRTFQQIENIELECYKKIAYIIRTLHFTALWLCQWIPIKFIFIHYSIASVLYRSRAYFYIFYNLIRKETVTEISFTCIKKNPYDVIRTWRLKNGTRKRVNDITRMKPVALNFLSYCTLYICICIYRVLFFTAIVPNFEHNCYENPTIGVYRILTNRCVEKVI